VSGRGVAKLGVCSWSLRPTSALDLCERARAAGLGAVQLALDPIRTGGDGSEWSEELALALCERFGLTLLSGMMAMEGEDYSTLDSIRRTGGIRPAAMWERNLAAAAADAALARRLGLRLVTFHAGFLPHDARDPERSTMIERLSILQRMFADAGVAVALETGQESAEILLAILQELADRGTPVGVNFDPANMVLYGMGDPVEALRQLAPWVQQIHIKDACVTDDVGQWGREMVVGEGQVRWAEFARMYHDAGLSCDLVIEREGGDERVKDVRTAASVVRRYWSVR
jgi:L-ribulose-5-phosphate 3-epimerase